MKSYNVQWYTIKFVYKYGICQVMNLFVYKYGICQAMNLFVCRWQQFHSVLHHHKVNIIQIIIDKTFDCMSQVIIDIKLMYTFNYNLSRKEIASVQWKHSFFFNIIKGHNSYSWRNIMNLNFSEIILQGVTVFNANFNNISVTSWQSALLVEGTGVPGENHRSAKSLTNLIT